MRAPDLDDVVPRSRTCRGAWPPGAERGDEPVARGLRDGDVERRRDDVVARLAEVHVVVGVDRRLVAELGAEASRSRGCSAPRSCSCSTRCPSRSGRRRPGTRRRAAPASHLVGGRDDRVGEAALEESQVGVRPRRRPLDGGERRRNSRGIAPPGDLEVLDRALGLRAPQATRRDLHLPHRVALGPGSVGHGVLRVGVGGQYPHASGDTPPHPPIRCQTLFACTTPHPPGPRARG